MPPTTRIGFGTRFRQSDYLRVLEAVAEIGEPRVVTLGMARVEWAQANAMVPLISTVDRLTRAGWEFLLEPPVKDFEFRYFEKSGWLAGFQGEKSPSIVPGRSFVPLQRYRSVGELDSVFKSLVKRLFEESEMAPGVFTALEWSIYEIADNVVNHAGANAGWIQLITQREKGLIEVVVSDAGLGIRETLGPSIPGIANDIDAINCALNEGVTRSLAHGLGNGLAGVERVSEASSGWLTLHTCKGATVVREGSRTDEVRPEHPGTVVSLTLPIDCEVDVETALWGSAVPSLENDYLDGGSGGYYVNFCVASECRNVGTRHAAKLARVKLKNLLAVFPDEPLVLDFQQVGTMASSFADELIGRLSEELGPDQFSSRIKFNALDDLNSATVSRVVAQRRTAEPR